MGTRRKVAVWYMRRPGEYVVIPPGWRTEYLIFQNRRQMVEFARASRLILKERPDPREQNHQTMYIPRAEYIPKGD